MTDEQKVAFVNAQAACAMAEMMGMAAENAVRASKNQAQAYPGGAFFALADKYLIGHNAVISFFHGD